jgi:hypothetical protein
MNNQNETKRALPLGVRVAMCLAIGAALTASLNLATGIAIAGGLFAALMPARRRC